MRNMSKVFLSFKDAVTLTAKNWATPFCSLLAGNNQFAAIECNWSFPAQERTSCLAGCGRKGGRELQRLGGQKRQVFRASAHLLNAKLQVCDVRQRLSATRKCLQITS